jgi:hypothetical protein
MIDFLIINQQTKINPKIPFNKETINILIIY